MSGGAHVKRVRALHRRQEREAQGVFLVQGRKLIAELLASGHELAELFAAEAVAREMNLPGARVVPAKDLERMGTFEQGNEVVGRGAQTPAGTGCNAWEGGLPAGGGWRFRPGEHRHLVAHSRLVRCRAIVVFAGKRGGVEPQMRASQHGVHLSGTRGIR